MFEFVPEEMRLAVKKGAVWLDAAAPGWAERVAKAFIAESLDMRACDSCVLGWVFAEEAAAAPSGRIFTGYDYGCAIGTATDVEEWIAPYRNVSEVIAWAEDHGFIIVGDSMDADKWGLLAQAWEELLAERGVL